jgi:hypothetical protein
VVEPHDLAHFRQSFPDTGACNLNVRFTPVSGHRELGQSFPKSAKAEVASLLIASSPLFINRGPA